METTATKQTPTQRKAVRQSFLKAGNKTFCIEERGDKNAEPILLIMGLACQMTHWPESLLNGQADRGYRVIRFDNRDSGLSEKVKSVFRINTRRAYLAYKLGINPKANYTLHDMAHDCANILDAMNIKSAHIVGASMGGMIGQLLAAHYPDHVRSLTAIMSSTNSPKLPMPELRLMIKLSQAGGSKSDMNAVLHRWEFFWKSVQSPAYPKPIAEIKAQIEANYHRNYCPAGTLRQIQAMLATGSLERAIKDIEAPTLVIHGDKDPLLKPACGKAIAKHINGARLELIKGMGHDLPEPLIPVFTDLIDNHASHAKGLWKPT